jgi:DeoR/GlpR family transcriptional regulator of sugar metabolism
MIEQRKQQRAYEKRCLGCYTAHFLRKHFSDVPVAVDGGSTNLEVIKAIHQDSKAGRSTASFVLTNNLEGLYLAARDRPAIRAEKPNWRSTGGVLRDGYMTLIAGAEASITNLSFSVAVIGANGFWPPYLMTNTPTEQAL